MGGSQEQIASICPLPGGVLGQSWASAGATRSPAFWLPHVLLWVLGSAPPLDASSNGFHWHFAMLLCVPSPALDTLTKPRQGYSSSGGSL